MVFLVGCAHGVYDFKIENPTVGFQRELKPLEMNKGK